MRSPSRCAGLQVATWEPPASPFGLIEEQLFTNPWKLLVACLLLNKTTAQAVRKVTLEEPMLRALLAVHWW